jgi:hypothetical protein
MLENSSSALPCIQRSLARWNPEAGARTRRSAIDEIKTLFGYLANRMNAPRVQSVSTHRFMPLPTFARKAAPEANR